MNSDIICTGTYYFWIEKKETWKLSLWSALLLHQFICYYHDDRWIKVIFLNKKPRKVKWLYISFDRECHLYVPHVLQMEFQSLALRHNVQINLCSTSHIMFMCIFHTLIPLLWFITQEIICRTHSVICIMKADIQMSCSYSALILANCRQIASLGKGHPR